MLKVIAFSHVKGQTEFFLISCLSQAHLHLLQGWDLYHLYDPKPWLPACHITSPGLSLANASGIDPL